MVYCRRDYSGNYAELDVLNWSAERRTLRQATSCARCGAKDFPVALPGIWRTCSVHLLELDEASVPHLIDL